MSTTITRRQFYFNPIRFVSAVAVLFVLELGLTLIFKDRDVGTALMQGAFVVGAISYCMGCEKRFRRACSPCGLSPREVRKLRAIEQSHQDSVQQKRERRERCDRNI